MNKTEILVIGNNEDRLQTLENLINNTAECRAVIAATDEEAIEKFHQKAFDLVLLTKYMEEEEEKKLRKILTHQNPDLIIMQDLNGNDGLLRTEIADALVTHRKNKKPSFSFVDDALKNARLNINIE